MILVLSWSGNQPLPKACRSSGPSEQPAEALAAVWEVGEWNRLGRMRPSAEVGEDGQRCERVGAEQCHGPGCGEVEQDGQRWPGVSAGTVAGTRGPGKGQV